MEHTFCFRFFLFVFFLTAIIPLQKAYAQDISPVIISEVQIAGEDSGESEYAFVRLYNTTGTVVSLKGMSLTKKTSSCGSSSNIASTTSLSLKTIQPYSTFTIATVSYQSIIGADMTYSTASTKLTQDNTIFLSDTLSNPIKILDKVGYGDACDAETKPIIGNPVTHIKRKQLNSETYIDTNSNNDDFVVLNTQTPVPTPTPTPIITATFSTSTAIRIDEMLPDPTEGQEFIELYNFGDTAVDLTGWSLRDASKTGKYTFKNSAVIKAQSYLTLYRDTFSFALNNTDETVTLLDPQEQKIDTIHYIASKEDVSYNYSPSGWRWSNQITPDTANQFSALPNVKTTVPKHIYKDTPAEFKAKNTDENNETKCIWNFGDGHSSRLADATHTYDKTGRYTVTLTTSTAIEDIVKTYSVKVRALPAQKILITEINPNPTGLDTGNESITIKNTSNKKINLLHWGIATGTDKKALSNHPITASLVIKPGKELLLTRDLSAFTLPNKGGFIELRRLDKKVVDKIQYASSEGERENMRYQLSSDEKTWSWVQTDAMTTADTGTDAKNSVNDSSLIQETSVQQQNIPTENDIINRLDTLSVDELTLLKTHIEEKLLTAMNTETKPQPKNVTVKTDAPIEIDPEFFPKQSLIGAFESPAERIVALVDKNIPTRKIAVSLTHNASLLAQEPLLFPEQIDLKNQKIEFVRHLNRTINNFLQK